MILEIVEFDRPEGFSDADLLADARSTIPRWKGYNGLIRKHFVTNGAKVMGVYIWESREAAARGHDAAWIEGFVQRTGVRPDMRIYDMFMEIDNLLDHVQDYPLG